MRPGAKRALALWGLTAIVAVASMSGPSPAGADQIEADYSTQGWFDRTRSNPVAVEVPGQGAVSPGASPAPPNNSEGTFVIASLGGDAGADGGDMAWYATQWDVFAAFGGTVDSFVVTFTESSTGNGDRGAPLIRACNIVVGWGSNDSVDSWENRPVVDCSVAKAPVRDLEAATWTFDLTSFAQTWVDGTGHGVAIVPGDASDPSATVGSFQLSLAGYPHPNVDERPVAVFSFTPPSFDGPVGPPIVNTTLPPPPPPPTFTTTPPLDNFLGDVGSDPVAAPPPVTSAPPVATPQPSAPPTVLAAAGASDHSFSWSLLLLLPLMGAAFWSTGTALSLAGDPVPPRRGGLAQLLSQQSAGG